MKITFDKSMVSEEQTAMIFTFSKTDLNHWRPAEQFHRKQAQPEHIIAVKNLNQTGPNLLSAGSTGPDKFHMNRSFLLDCWKTIT